MFQTQYNKNQNSAQGNGPVLCYRPEMRADLQERARAERRGNMVTAALAMVLVAVIVFAVEVIVR